MLTKHAAAPRGRFIGSGFRLLSGGLLLAGLLSATGCHRDMRDQPKFKTYAATDFFGDRRAMRPPVAGTVARGQLLADTLLYTGKVGKEFAAEYPFEITREVLERGRDRFNIYCTPCHDRTGSGRGMIVLRGLKQPPSYHIDRLRNSPPGYFFDVMTNGFGVMYDYSAQIRPEDRWAIAAWIKVLQYSQNATVADVPAAARPWLDHPEQQPIPGREAGGHEGGAHEGGGSHGTTEGGH